MYLKSIQIHGFKSFADKTKLEFLPPKRGVNSVTSIVGPNGSGKSNVSDAIKWVMGEQRLTQLRGKKSEDVIFAGSQNKGKMGMASVELVLDNSDGTAPIEYDELIIARRLYRSGESEYLVNGKPVRLLDIQLLLAKSQFAQGSYTVVSQGMISKLLLQSAEERKGFFDEAVGIKEFQIKRHQAHLKLNRTRTNIEQAELLLKEISPRLKSLSKQVKKLEERQEIEIELRESSERYYVTLYSNQKEHIDTITASIKELAAKSTEAEAALLVSQEALGTLAREESRQDQFAALQTELSQVQQEEHERERTIAVLDGKMQTQLTNTGKHDVSWLKSKVSELEQKVATLSTTHTAAAKELESFKQEKATLDASIESLRQEKTDLEVARQLLVSESLRADAKAEVDHIIGVRAVQAILEERHRFGKVHGAVAQLASVDAKYAMALEVAAGGHLASLVVADDRVAQAAVQYLRENRLGYATFLPLTTIRPRPIPGDIDRYLNMPGVQGLAVDLIECDETFDDVFLYVLGSTLVVDTIDTARQVGIGNYRMVTLEGDVLERGGSVKGGFRKRREGSLRFGTNLATTREKDEETRAREIAEIDEKLTVIAARILELETDQRLLEMKVQTAEGQLTLSAERQKDADTELASVSQDLSLVDVSPEEYDAVMKTIATEKETHEATLAALKTKEAEIRTKIASFNEDEESKKQRVFALQDEMTKQQEGVNALLEEKGKLAVDLARYETKQEDLIREVEDEMHTSIASIVAREPEVLGMDAVQSVHDAMQKLKYKLSLIGGIDEVVVAEHTETKERFDGLDMQLKDLKKAMKDLESLIDDLDEVMRKKRKKGFKQIRIEFQRYFEILFEGGKADLIEIYGDDAIEEELDEEGNVIETKTKGKKILKGIDISANPPGKKIKNIQVLSGGERTMTSIALICAILRTNPSPFVVLDEVEAALDEANSLRFTNILKELSTSSQFILITHNRATMHAADALYGVTMGNNGVSKLVSVKMD